MSNPFFDLQEAVQARLEAHEFLTDIPMVTEVLGDLTKRIEVSLMKGGVKQNAAGKSGIALLILTPKGRPLSANTRTLAPQLTTVRISMFVKPLINDGASGLQKAPLDVHHAILQQMLSWDRGPVFAGKPVELELWDSRETPTGELSYFADYSVVQFLNLTP